MKKDKETIYGSIQTTYENIILPLEEAHKLQAILAKAKRLDTLWRSNKPEVACLMDYDVPAVLVKKVLPEQDARGVPREIYHEWREAIQAPDAAEEYMGIREYWETRK